MKHFAQIALVAILLFGSGHCFAQFTSDQYTALKQKYKTEGLVYLNKSIQLDFKQKDGKIICEENETEQIIYLRNASIFNSGMGTSESTFYELTDFEANVYNLKKNKYKRKKVKDFTVSDNQYNTVFFDDNKSYVFKFPGVANGSIVELKTEHVSENPRFTPSVFVQQAAPVEKFNLKVTFDNDIEMAFLERNTRDFSIVKDSTKDSRRTTYEWKFDDVPAYIDEDHTAGLKHTIFHIIPYVKSAKLNGKKVNYHASPKDLYAFYFSCIKNLRDSTDLTELREITETITKDCKTNFEKVQRIYKWAQENIKYIAFEAGMEGFIPRKSDDVLHKKYGDCKDNSNIMHDMLHLAGVKSHLTWVGTRSLPYSYYELPTVHSDNHMILTYEENGKYYFLDATGRYLSPELPSSFIQGKEAMLAIDKDSFQIVKVPIIDAHQNALRDSVFLTLEGKSLSGKGVYCVSGYRKINFQYRIEGLEDEKLTRTIEAYVEKGNNKFKLKGKPTVTGNGYDKIMRVDYDFTLDDYVQQVDNEVYVNLNLAKRWNTIKLKNDRKEEMHFEDTHFVESYFVLEIPADYELVSLPKAKQYNAGDISFAYEYQKKGNKIVYRQTITLNTVKITKDRFSEWNKFSKALSKAYSKSIVLKKKTL